LVPQFASHRAEDAGATRVEVLADDDRGIFVELQVRAVGPAHAVARADDHGLHDLALLDRHVGRRFLHRRDDDVADVGVGFAGTAHHPNYQQLLGAGIIGDHDAGFLLNHSATPPVCSPATCTT